MKIAIYGASGFGREVAWLISELINEGAEYEIACFIDDDPAKYGKMINGFPVKHIEEVRLFASKIALVSGIGKPSIREVTVNNAISKGYFFPSIIHPSVYKSDFIEIDQGSVICAGCILTTNIQIGKHVQVNIDCTIGHDVNIGDYTTLAPGVHVSGCVHFGKRVYVGTGAVFINGTEEVPLKIADDSIIGAGAVVTKPIHSAGTWVGVPAKPLRRFNAEE